MTPREIALQIVEPWFNGDPCEGCGCAKVCTKLVERIESAIQSERSADAGKTSDHIPDATKMVHYRHCNQGDCIGHCKYGEEDCPVMATSQESRQIEPVAWLLEAYDIHEQRTLQRLVFEKPKNMQHVKITAYYTVPPKREPLTDEEIVGMTCECIDDGAFDMRCALDLARAMERAHGIGGKE